MSKTDWLWLAGAVIWLGFGLYLAWLGLRQKRLERRLEQLLRLMPENSVCELAASAEADASGETAETGETYETGESGGALHSSGSSE